MSYSFRARLLHASLVSLSFSLSFNVARVGFALRKTSHVERRPALHSVTSLYGVPRNYVREKDAEGLRGGFRKMRKMLDFSHISRQIKKSSYAYTIIVSRHVRFYANANSIYANVLKYLNVLKV